jgi:hypothetical protein
MWLRRRKHTEYIIYSETSRPACESHLFSYRVSNPDSPPRSLMVIPTALLCCRLKSQEKEITRWVEQRMKYPEGITSCGICLAIQNYLFLCEIRRLQGAVSRRQVDVTCRPSLKCWLGCAAGEWAENLRNGPKNSKFQNFSNSWKAFMKVYQQHSREIFWSSFGQLTVNLSQNRSMTAHSHQTPIAGTMTILAYLKVKLLLFTFRQEL